MLLKFVYISAALTCVAGMFSVFDCTRHSVQFQKTSYKVCCSRFASLHIFIFINKFVFTQLISRNAFMNETSRCHIAKIFSPQIFSLFVWEVSSLSRFRVFDVLARAFAVSRPSHTSFTLFTKIFRVSHVRRSDDVRKRSINFPSRFNKLTNFIYTEWENFICHKIDC